MSNWASWSDFAAMGGYGVYVWGSFGMCAAVLVLELLLLKARRRALVHDAQEASDDAAGGMKQQGSRA